jgi:hypothetical protein
VSASKRNNHKRKSLSTPPTSISITKIFNWKVSLMSVIPQSTNQLQKFKITATVSNYYNNSKPNTTNLDKPMKHNVHP